MEGQSNNYSSNANMSSSFGNSSNLSAMEPHQSSSSTDTDFKQMLKDNNYSDFDLNIPYGKKKFFFFHKLHTRGWDAISNFINNN